MKKVAIVMGSDSDLGVMEKAAKKLESFGVEYEMRIMSAHRTPAAASEFSANAKANGFGVIIAAAGKAAHLGGVLAAHTTLPEAPNQFASPIVFSALPHQTTYLLLAPIPNNPNLHPS